MDIDTFNVKIELPEGASFEYTAKKALEIEQFVRDTVPKEDLLNIATKIGQHNTDIYGAIDGRNPAWALLTVYMLPQGQRKTNSVDVIAELREKLKDFGEFQSIQVEPLKDTPVQGKPVELEIIGNDSGRFEMSDIILDYLKNYNGVTEAWTSYKPGKEIIELNLDHAIMAGYGITRRM